MKVILDLITGKIEKCAPEIYKYQNYMSIILAKCSSLILIHGRPIKDILYMVKMINAILLSPLNLTSKVGHLKNLINGCITSDIHEHMYTYMCVCVSTLDQVLIQ